MGTTDFPNFRQELKGLEVLEGRPVHLEAKLTPVNDSTMKVEWFFEERPLQMGSRIKTVNDFGFVSLDISQCIPEDSGTYTVVATNSRGTTESTAKVICYKTVDTMNLMYDDDVDDYLMAQQGRAPQFVVQPRSAEVREGQRVHFEARVVPQGDSSLRVEWYKDGQPMQMASRIHIQNDFGCIVMSFNPCYPEDSGTYTCVASNRFGKAEATATIVCHGRETLILHTQHADALEKIGHIEGQSIHIGPIPQDRPEEFQSMQQPRVTRPLQDAIQAKEGHPVHFECRLQPINDPKMKVEWFHNDQPLQSGHRFKPMFDFGYVALDILYAYPEDSGVYTVVATNSLGTVQTQSQLQVTGKKTLYLEPQHPESHQRIAELEQPKGPVLHEGPEAQCTAAPKILNNLKGLVLKEGANLHLETRITPQHDPTMVVEWYVNGYPLLTGSRVRSLYDFGFVSLDVIGVIPEDAGVYTLRLANALGETQAEAQVEVQAKASILSDTQHQESLGKIHQLETAEKFRRPEIQDVGPNEGPVFSQQLPQQLDTISEGSTVHLECQVSPINDQTMQIDWYRDGQPIPYGHRYRMFHDFGFISLDILTMYPEDSGTYTCVARNALGEARTDCTIQCKPISAILSQTQHPTSVQRIKELEAPKPEAEEEPEAAIEQPFFLQPLKDVTDINEGEFVHLECQLTPVNDPNLIVEWYVNGVPLQHGHRFQMSRDFGFIALNVLYIYPEDSGTYSCIARNAAGEAQSSCTVTCRGKKSMLLDTQHPSSLQRIRELEAPRAPAPDLPDEPKQIPVFTQQLQNLQDLKESQTAHLECHVTPVTDPDIRIEWFHNGKPLSAGHRFRTTYDFGYVSMDILWVYPEDNGTFTCRATNSMGSAETSCTLSCSGKRSILSDAQHPESWKKIKQMEEAVKAQPTEPELPKVQPRFTKQLEQRIELKEGQSAHLECLLEPANDNSLRVEWYANGVPLKQGHRFRPVHDFGYVSLDILYAYAEDSGSYICRAYNDVGEATTHAEIICAARRNLYLETQHAESWRRVQELENKQVDRPPSPEKVWPKPQFTQMLTNFDDVQEGQSVHLECRLQPVGDPTLRVEWLCNGQKIAEGHRFRPSHDFDFICLDILTTYGEDSGVYSCRAVSEFGEAVTSCTVKCAAKASLLLDVMHENSWQQIQELESRRPAEVVEEERPVGPPVFTVQIPPVAPCQEGHPVHFECQVEPTHDNKLQIHWFHNGAPLVAGHRFHVTHDFGYVAMDILYAFPEDSGVWTCVATNEHGQAETTVNLEVQSRRSIVTDVQHPESWQRIQEIEAPKPILPPAPTPAPGPPRFTVQMNNVEGRFESQPVHFECRLTPINDPNMRIEWFHNGVPLSLGNRFKETCDFGYVSLDLAYAYAEDSGVYICKASNEEGEATTQGSLEVAPKDSLLLDTQHPQSLERIRSLEAPKPGAAPRPDIKIVKPHFTQELNSCIDLIEGQPAHFEALLQPVNDPNLKVEWLKDGHPLPAGSRFQLHHDFGFVSLDILYVLPEDVGTYTCRAVNKLGQAQTSGQLECKARSSIYLETLHGASLEKIRIIEAPKAPPPQPEAPTFQKPMFTDPLQNIEGLAEGQPALLEGRIIPTNDPKLRVEWYFNDKPLQNSNRMIITHEFGYVAVAFKYVNAEDTGVYMCRLVNELGEAVSSASVKIEGKKSLILDVQHPKSFQKIKELEAMDKYPKTEVADRVFEKPVFIQSLANVDNLKEGDVAHLEARLTPVGDPKLRVQWYHNDKPVDYGSRIRPVCDFGFVTLDFQYVYPEDSGIYTCRAVNEHGEAQTSCSFKVEGYESILRDTQHPVSWQMIQDLERPIVKEEFEPEVVRIKPHFTVGLANQEDVPEGQPVHLEAHFEPARDDTLRVIWERNGQHVPAGQLVKTSHELGVATLDIVNAYADHSGMYTVKLVNQVGDAASSATVKVLGRGNILGDTQHAASWARVQELEAPKPQEPPPPDAEYPAPTFLAHLNNVECNEGEPAHFECQVQPAQDPTLKIEWFLNGKPLDAGSKYSINVDFGFVTMDIQYAYPEDSGVFMCKASNTQGEAVTSGTLKCQGKDSIITDPQQAASLPRIAELEAPKAAAPEVPDKPTQAPKFTSQLGDLGDLQEGQAAHFEAHVEPIDAQTEWLHNGQPVEASSRIKIINDFGWVILDIAQVESRDTGEWIAHAYNSAGEDFSKGYINCVGKENIISDPMQPQSLQRIIELERPKAQPEAPATKAAQPPKFIVPLTTIPELDEGDSVHLEAQLVPVDDPNLQVEWFHNGRPLSFGHRYRPLHDFGFCVLDILYAMPEDNGEFSCRAVNKMGQDTTKTAIQCKGKAGLITHPQIREDKYRNIQTLEESLHRVREDVAQDKPKHAPVFVEPLQNPPPLREGENAYFSARLTPTDDPDLRVEWYFNGRPLKTGSRVKTICDFGVVILEIAPIYPEDSGEYVCKARNSVGEAVTKAQLTCEGKQRIIAETQLPLKMAANAQQRIMQLEQPKPGPQAKPDVNYGPPKFTSQLTDMPELVEGQLAHFECQLQPLNDPNLKVEWFHNGQPIVNSSRMKMIHDFGFVILEIAPAEPQDIGQYVCRARNKFGEASTQCSINVEGRSGIVYDWQMPSKKEQITELEDFLNQPKEFIIPPDKEFGPPEFLAGLTDLGEMMVGDAAHLECKLEPVGDPSLRIEWLHNGKHVPYGSRIQPQNDFGFIVLDIHGLIPEDSGEYVCRATNKSGTVETKGSLTCKSTIHVDPPVFVTPLLPEIPGVQEGDTVHLECRVTPITDPYLKIEWLHNGQPLSYGHRFKTMHDFGYVSLDILYAYPEDSGTYTCRATNEKGTAKCDCKFTVGSRPGLVFQRQAPKQSKTDLDRHLLQYTNAQVVLQEADLYTDGMEQKPVFKSQLHGESLKELTEGNFCRLEAQLAPINDPSMRVEWFLNGKPVMLGHRLRPTLEHGFVSLDLLYTLPDDSGTYTARATNKFGSAESKVEVQCEARKHVIMDSQMPQGLLVKSMNKMEREQELYWSTKVDVETLPKQKMKPQFTIPPQPRQVMENEPARFEVAVIGNPKPRVTWYINGREAITGSRYKLSYDGLHYLVIPQVKPSDAGEVVVVAKNAEGETRLTTSLDIFLGQDFRQHQLKPATRVTEEEMMDREQTWKVETQGHLGQVFQQQPRADLMKLMKVETIKTPGEPLETPELQDKFARTKDEGFYDKILQADHPKMPYPGVTLEPVQLKPANVVRRDLPTEEVEQVALRPAPRSDRTDTVPKEPRGTPWRKPAALKTEEEVEKKFKLRPPPPKEVEVPAKDQVQLKMAKPKPASEPPPFDHVTVEKPGPVGTLKQGPPQPEEKSVPHSQQVRLRPAFRPKATAEVQTELEKPSLKPAPPPQQKVDERTQIEERMQTKVSHKSETHEMNGKIVKMTSYRQQMEHTFASESHGFVDSLGRITTPAPGAPTSKRQSAPQFQQQLQPCNAEIGRPARFQIQFAGSEPVTVNWMRNGRILQSSFEFQIKTTSTTSILEIPKMRADYAGEYKVVLENVAGKAESVSNLVIAAKKDTGAMPQFVQAMGPSSCAQGQPARFDVTVDATPKPVVSWFKDGRPVAIDARFKTLTNGKQYSLVITEAYPQDSGMYECVAKNAKGENRCQAPLNVSLAKPATGVGTGAKAPQFLEPIRPMAIQEGKPAKFTAKVTGTPEPKVQWFRNGAAIGPNQFMKMSLSAGTATLEISECRSSDEGEYRLEATNDSGKASCAGSLKVQPKPKTSKAGLPGTGKPEPPKIVDQLKDTEVKANQRAVLTVGVTGSPKPQIQWMLNGRPLQKTSDLNITPTDDGSSLVINRMTSTHIGKYSAKATNQSGQAETSCQLRIST